MSDIEALAQIAEAQSIDFSQILYRDADRDAANLLYAQWFGPPAPDHCTSEYGGIDGSKVNSVPCKDDTFIHCNTMAEYYAAAREAKVTIAPLYGAIDWSKVEWCYGGIPTTSEAEKRSDERKAFRIKEGLEVPTLVTPEDSVAICGHASRSR